MHRASVLALALACSAAMLLGTACGDGSDSGGSDEGTSTSVAVTTAASDLLPDLSGDGFDQTAPETVPNTGELDIAFRLYDRKSAPAVQARTEVRVYPSIATAESDFPLQAEGWKSPPPGLFGGDPANEESEALSGLDDAAAYIATNRDPEGFRLWTDVYRIGNVIVVAHVLGQNEADVTPVRQSLADAMTAAVR